MTSTFDRRELLQLAGLSAGAIAAGGLLSGCRSGESGGSGGGDAGGGNRLQINSFGGTFQEAIQKTVVDPFESKFDAEVSVTTAISSEALTRLKSSPEGKPALDVAYMDLAVIYQAKEAGLLQPIDASKVPSIKDLYPLAVDEQGFWVAELASMTGIAYNTEKVKTPPKSWQDLWDSKYEKKVTISDVAGTAGYQFLVQAARMNGGDEGNIDPGFKAMSDLKPNIVSIYKTPDEASRLLSSGEAWLGPWYADRTSAAKSSGAPVAFAEPEEGAIAVLSAMCIPKGTSVLDLAHNYIDFQLSAEVNKEFVTTVAEGPTNSKVKIEQEFLDNNYVPYGEEQISSLINLDSEKISASLSEWITRWASEVAN
ncbi:ABC transporter substrate-binding protein [Saxibacter everestensis]|uniref:ABC transporter substrate-binding protein n=1 Tax=Saxibacter everestensis TaxID=2909229 RepID=A0ABY8QR66_9MICO|nr:ABC transporter substrate-binding protein [Brevibacteriaceae bacterium ZFBP1038]